jgi:hypothetical protein
VTMGGGLFNAQIRHGATTMHFLFIQTCLKNATQLFLHRFLRFKGIVIQNLTGSNF